MSLSLSGATSGAIGGGMLGGPIGAVAGGLAGLFSGGDNRSEMRYEMRDFTPDEQRAVNQIMGMYPGALEAMSAEERSAVFQRMRQVIRDEGLAGVNQAFSRARRDANLSFARTGGGPSSVRLYAEGELAQQEGEARAGVERNAYLAAESIASNRQNEAMNRLGTLTGAYGSLWQNRVVGQSNTYLNNNAGAAGMGLLGMGLTYDQSYFNRRYGGNSGEAAAAGA